MLSSHGLSPASYPEPAVHTEDISHHKCLIYEGDPSEQLPVVIPFLLEGLRNNWRCLYVGSPDSSRMVEQALTDRGVNTSRESARGALIFSSERTHLDAGSFIPRQMVDWLSGAVDDAVHSGFEGLYATGDMKWELGADGNFEHLLEYEARLEQLFQNKPVRGICQYHRNVLPPRAVQNALITHRSATLGSTLKRDNFFYIPPNLLLETESGASPAVGEWMCQQIVRVLEAESARDQALHALKESEAQQRHLAQQLAEMNRDLEQRVQERTSQLEQANRELEAFSYSVSHDLRSPLQHINGFASLLAESYDAELDAKARDYLMRIQVGTKQMAGLIEDLLRLAKIAQAELSIGKVQLSTIAQNVASTFRFIDPARKVEVRIEPNLDVQGDLGLLRVAMENLLSNAWKYTSGVKHAVIEFGAISGPGGKTYFVRDNGAGFDMKNADKLFAPFQRMHREEEFSGHGIGLATVYRIVHRHRGRIWAEAEPGRGATFYFELNCASPTPA